jgi:hypothetical protein
LRRQLGQLGATLSRCRADNSARRQGANGIAGGKKTTTGIKRTRLREENGRDSSHKGHKEHKEGKESGALRAVISDE